MIQHKTLHVPSQPIARQQRVTGKTNLTNVTNGNPTRTNPARRQQRTELRRAPGIYAIRDSACLLRSLASVLMVVLFIGACQSAERRPAPERSSGDSDSLLAAGIGKYAATRDASQALEWLRKAAEQAPKRTELQWLYAYFCSQSYGCDAAPAETRVRNADPGNGITWMGALARAQQQRDASAEDAVLEALSRSQRIDVYWNTTVSRAALALRGTKVNEPGLEDPLTKALNTATDQFSLLAVAALRPVVAACSLQRLQRIQTAQRCALIAQSLQRSDTYIAAGVGLGIEEHLAASGTVNAATVAEKIRGMRYQQETAGRIMEGQVDRAALSQELIELMQKLRREQEVYAAVLRWAGQPAGPE